MSTIDVPRAAQEAHVATATSSEGKKVDVSPLAIAALVTIAWVAWEGLDGKCPICGGSGYCDGAFELKGLKYHGPCPLLFIPGFH